VSATAASTIALLCYLIDRHLMMTCFLVVMCQSVSDVSLLLSQFLQCFIWCCICYCLFCIL